MKELVSLAAQVGAVNRIFTSLDNFRGMTKDDVTLLYDFLQTAPALIDFERLFAGLISTMADASSNPIVRSFAEDISTIDAVVDFSDVTSLNPSVLWKRELDDLDRRVKEQSPVTKEAEEDYQVAKKEYYDYLQKDDCSEVTRATLQRSVDLRKKEFDEEKEKLDRLAEEYAQVEMVAKRIKSQEMAEIGRKCQDYLHVMRKYLPGIGAPDIDINEILSEGATSDGTLNSTPSKDIIDEKYLPLKITSLIHDLCDGKQFELSSAINFHRVFNLDSEAAPLQIKMNKKKTKTVAKARVCYLIDQLEKFVEESLQKEWGKGILAALDIDHDYYDSKYAKPVSDDRSHKDEEFVEAIEEVLAKFR